MCLNRKHHRTGIEEREILPQAHPEPYHPYPSPRNRAPVVLTHPGRGQLYQARHQGEVNLEEFSVIMGKEGTASHQENKTAQTEKFGPCRGLRG